jgi:hypothetical protein
MSAWNASSTLARAVMIWLACLIVPTLLGCLITLGVLWIKAPKEVATGLFVFNFAFANAFTAHNAFGTVVCTCFLCLVYLSAFKERMNLISAMFVGIAAGAVKVAALLMWWWLSTHQGVHPDYFRSLWSELGGALIVSTMLACFSSPPKQRYA